jgi:hypothetical protein
VACRGERVVGVLQLTYIPSLTYQGGWRALIEGVRVDGSERSQGLGRAHRGFSRRDEAPPEEGLTRQIATSPRRMPMVTASVRLPAPSLDRIEATWNFAV